MKNKTVLLAVVGLAGGAVAGFVTGGNANIVVSFAVVGGIIGFLAGWVWQTKTGGGD